MRLARLLIPALLFSFVLAACSFELGPRTTSLRLSVGSPDVGRYLSPALSKLVLQGQGPAGNTLAPYPLAGGVNTIQGLAGGTWTFEVRGYDDQGSLLERGMAVVELQLGPNPVTISLSSATVPEFQWTDVSLPGGLPLITGAQVYSGGDPNKPSSGPMNTLANDVISPLFRSSDTIVVSAAIGTGYQYRWMLDGALLVGQTSSTLTLTIGSSLTASGSYSLVCLVTGPDGTVYSEQILIILGLPA